MHILRDKIRPAPVAIGFFLRVCYERAVWAVPCKLAGGLSKMCEYDRLKNSTFRTFLMVALTCVAAEGHAVAERFAFERHMMGTSVEVIVWSPDRDASEKAVERAYAEIERIEKKLSVRKKDSRITEINQWAGTKPVKVDDEMYRLIRESKRFSEMSGGAFDISVQGLGDIWDFTRPGFREPGPDRVKKGLKRVDYRKIRLNEGDSTVFLEEGGMEISLGGIAKGYAVDRAVGILRESGIKGGIVSAGGDLLAFGRKGNGEVWKVGVRNPRDHKKNICVLPVSNLSVATSGDYERYRMIDGKRVHHIIDPRTGYPSTGCMSATVVAKGAMTADALATAVFVLGPEAGLALLEALPGVEGILVDSDGKTSASKGLAGFSERSLKEKPDRLDSHQKHNESIN
jgi:thiamine biosynthesis lipoprotein